MSETKHTQGPWQLDRDYEGGLVLAMGTRIGSRGSYESHHEIELYDGDLLDPEHGNEAQVTEAEANARLIAAAPDLLDAAQNVIQSFGGGGVDLPRRMDELEAAIAKATGGAS